MLSRAVLKLKLWTSLASLFRFIESEGQILGEEVIRVMTWTKRTPSDVRISGLETTMSSPGRKRTNGNAMDPKTREGIEGVYVDGPALYIHVGVLGIGTTALVSVGGEIYTAIGLRAKNEAPLKNTMLVTSANGRVPGYIPDDASYGHQTFQVLNTALKPGCAEPTLVNAIADLETQYLISNKTMKLIHAMVAAAVLCLTLVRVSARRKGAHVGRQCERIFDAELLLARRDVDAGPEPKQHRRLNRNQAPLRRLVGEVHSHDRLLDFGLARR
jgi:hypothetical protein